MDIKFTETSIVSVMIVTYVGLMGLVSLYLHADMIATACASGLVGYLGRGLANRNEEKNTPSSDECEDCVA